MGRRGFLAAVVGLAAPFLAVQTSAKPALALIPELPNVDAGALDVGIPRDIEGGFLVPEWFVEELRREGLVRDV